MSDLVAMPLLAHALPQSVGAVPLTIVITALVGLYLGVNAQSTRRVAGRLGQDPAQPAPTSVTPPKQRVTWDNPRPSPGQVVGLGSLALLAALASTGPTDPAENLTDAFVLTYLWGSVAISSMVLGAWWWRLDPLRGLTGLLSRAVGDPDQELARPLPPLLGTAAAITGLAAWAYVQLFVTPSVLTFQLLLIGYVVVHVAGASRYGLTWLQQTESLGVLSDTLGLLRPRGIIDRLTVLPDDGRLRWISAVLIGWSLTDLVIATERWHDLGLSSTTQTFAGASLLVAITGVVYGLIRATSGRARLGPAFVAVAGAWVFAHYLSLLVIDGQGVSIWLSDPFATGADLLGRADAMVDLQPVPLDLIAALQAVPFVLGHLVAVVVVQRRAARVITRPGQLGPVTFFARTVIAVLLLGGIYLQLGGL